MALANIKLLFSNLDAVRLVNVIYVRLKMLAVRAGSVSNFNSPRLILDCFMLQLLVYTCGEFLFIPAVGDLAIEACSLPSLWKKEETGHFRVISKKATRLALK